MWHCTSLPMPFLDDASNNWCWMHVAMDNLWFIFQIVLCFNLISQYLVFDNSVWWYCSCFIYVNEEMLLILLTYEAFSLLTSVIVGSLWEWKGILNGNVGFCLELMTLLMAAGHYLHIWWLHGMAFHFVDAVLFLILRVNISMLLFWVMSWPFT